MIINHNMEALFSHRQYKMIGNNLKKDIDKLTSGVKINSASDDAANLAVSDKMRNLIKGAYQAERNAENGISFVQTTDGYLDESLSLVQRIRELSIQSSNGVLSDEDRVYIQVEISQLIDEIDRIASTAQFNGLNMLTGRFSDLTKSANNPTSSMWFHLGAGMDQREQFFIGTVTSKALKLRDSANNLLSLKNESNSNTSLADIDTAIKKLNSQRADLGAYQNRLESALKKILSEAENLQSAESIIRDADMADVSVSYAKNKILLETSNSFIAQANIKNSRVFNFIK